MSHHEHKVIPSTFDNEYQQKALAFNTARSNQFLLKQKAEGQSLLVAGRHGFYSGIYYGGLFGLGVGIYKRKISPIYRYALGSGAIYSATLISSNFFRIDI